VVDAGQYLEFGVIQENLYWRAWMIGLRLIVRCERLKEKLERK
jgi:hypothetical protein